MKKIIKLIIIALIPFFLGFLEMWYLFGTPLAIFQTCWYILLIIFGIILSYVNYTQ